MTQADKDILLKDLCARLPYRVICQCDNIKTQGVLKEIGINYNMCRLYDSFTDEYENCYIFDCRPYLFPLSSMTKEQRIELYKALGLGYESHYHLSKEWEDFNDSIDNNDLFLPASCVSDLNKMYNYLNKNHFDYRGLIHMELANDATGLNIY